MNVCGALFTLSFHGDAMLWLHTVIIRTRAEAWPDTDSGLKRVWDSSEMSVGSSSNLVVSDVSTERSAFLSALLGASAITSEAFLKGMQSMDAEFEERVGLGAVVATLVPLICIVSSTFS